MRIIAGQYKGRRLAGPKNDAIRPTTDRVRESLFSIIGDLEGAKVLDAYAGTGALGCESFSRGAEKVWFFDRSCGAIELVRENVGRIDRLDDAVIKQMTMEQGISKIDEPVDVVFLDPPYGSGEPLVALTLLGNSEMVAEGALIILEQDVRDELPVSPLFEYDESREFGDTRISFYYKRPA